MRKRKYGPLLFLIFENELCKKLLCNAKLFADDTFLFFSVINKIDISRNDLNNEH